MNPFLVLGVVSLAAFATGLTVLVAYIPVHMADPESQPSDAIGWLLFSGGAGTVVFFTAFWLTS